MSALRWTNLFFALASEQLVDFLLLINVVFLQKFLMKPVRMSHPGYWILHLTGTHIQRCTPIFAWKNSDRHSRFTC